MSAETASEMLARLVLLYGAPKTDDQRAFMAEYRMALCGFADQALRKGFNDLLSNRVHRTWPTVGDCVHACRAAGEKLSAGGIKVRKRLPWEPEELECRLPTDEEKARVNALVQEFKRNTAMRSIAPTKRHAPCDARVFAEREAVRRAEEQARSYRHEEAANE